MRDAQGEATRGRLVDAARGLFVDRGFFATGTEEIVARAGVTRGALYHHFTDKEDLFRAVFEAVEIDLMSRVAAAMPPGLDSWNTVRAGLRAFLDASSEPEVQRVILLDGPVVLGWVEWRALEARFGLGAIEAALRDAMARGLVRPQPPGPLAHLVLAAVDEAALLVANADDPDVTRAEVGETLDQLLNGLRA